MTLPDFLQPESPFRPWAFAMGACLIASLPPRTRRMGGVLLFVVAGVAVLFFFLQDVFASFTPKG